MTTATPSWVADGPPASPAQAMASAPAGASKRIAVRLTVVGTSRATRPAAHQSQAAAEPTCWTSDERSARAAPTAGALATAWPSQTITGPQRRAVAFALCTERPTGQDWPTEAPWGQWRSMTKTGEGRPSMEWNVPAGSATAVGSLPHRDARRAASFMLEQLPVLATIPTLPRRSPAEGMIAQAVLGIQGFGLGPYGALGVDLDRIDPEAPVETDLDSDAFLGFRTFLEAARGRTGPVKWQFVGPVTLGIALQRAGVPSELAFRVAVTAVRSHVQALHRAIAEVLPESRQLVVLDEPSFAEVNDPEFPISLDAAIDAVSGALALIEQTAITGVHSCGAADWVSLIAAGPQVLSFPARPEIVGIGGYLARFLDSGGWVAWGAVPTDGPIPHSGDRPWKALSELWCELVKTGCDAVRLRTQSLITPACGLGLHSETVARHVVKITAELSHRVHSQAVATRLSIGA